MRGKLCGKRCANSVSDSTPLTAGSGSRQSAARSWGSAQMPPYRRRQPANSSQADLQAQARRARTPRRRRGGGASTGTARIPEPCTGKDWRCRSAGSPGCMSCFLLERRPSLFRRRWIGRRSDHSSARYSKGSSSAAAVAATRQAFPPRHFTQRQSQHRHASRGQVGQFWYRWDCGGVVLL